jgi:hypothetical protein
MSGCKYFARLEIRETVLHEYLCQRLGLPVSTPAILDLHKGKGLKDDLWTYPQPFKTAALSAGKLNIKRLILAVRRTWQARGICDMDLGVSLLPPPRNQRFVFASTHAWISRRFTNELQTSWLFEDDFDPWLEVMRRPSLVEWEDKEQFALEP